MYVHMASAGSYLWIRRVDTSACQRIIPFIIPFQYVTAHMSIHSTKDREESFPCLAIPAISIG